jgi:hypothetical protein
LTILAAAHTAATPLAANSTGSNIEPGLLGFLVVAAIGVALVFLLRSMNKQFRKIGPKPAEEAPETAPADDEPARESPATESLAKETADNAPKS